MAREVPVSVVGEVYHGRSVGFGTKGQLQLAGIAPAVCGAHGELSGVSGFAVGSGVAHCHGVAVGADKAPELVLEAVGAAVEVVGAVVDGEAVFLSVDNEVPSGYAVGISARHFSGAGAVGYVVGWVGIAENHIGELARAVGYVNLYDAGAESAEHYRCAAGVGESGQRDVA